MGKTMDKQQAFGHIASNYTKWPEPGDTTPTTSRGWYWVKKNGLIPSMVFQSIDSCITRNEYDQWRATPPPMAQPAPSPNYNPDNALQWCVDNITEWPLLNDLAPPPPECWTWSNNLSQTHKSLALLNDCGAVMAVIAKVNWEQAKAVVKTVNPIMKYFEFAHLPPHLIVTSELIHNLAHTMDSTLPNGAEKSAGLRKLLEAKDCFVRALV